jgi:hypothetical protein
MLRVSRTGRLSRRIMDHYEERNERTGRTNTDPLKRRLGNSLLLGTPAGNSVVGSDRAKQVQDPRG